MKFYISLFALFVSLLFSKISIAEESKARIGFATGFGFLVAGDKYVTGGFSLSPSILLGYKHDWIGISYQNLPNFNSFRKIDNIGLLDQNSLMLTLIPNEYTLFDIGPSVDFFSMIMCSNYHICDRQTGFALGGHFRTAITKRMMSVGVGVVANFHISIIPSPALYNGIIFTSNIGPVWEF